MTMFQIVRYVDISMFDEDSSVLSIPNYRLGWKMQNERMNVKQTQ